MNELWTLLLKFEMDLGETFLAMAPYLLFGFIVAGILSVFVSPTQVQRHLGGHGFLPVLKAALFGIPLPLCSCSVIPVTASLRRHGAGRGASTAFLISTPQTGVDSILVTYSLLGPVFAIFRPLAALVSGVIGGAAADVLEPHGEKDTQVLEPCQDACCNGGNGHGKLRRALEYGFADLPRDIGKALLFGILIAGAIAAVVPDDYFIAVGTGFVGILVMMLLGVPVYVCATASVPIAAALMMKGVSPGAALAFLMTGPASNAAGIATVWKIMGARTALVYLASVALTALGAGLLLDLVISHAGSIAQIHEMTETAASPVSVASAVILLAVLAVAAFRRTADAHAHGLDHEHADHPEQVEHDPECHCHHDAE